MKKLNKFIPFIIIGSIILISSILIWGFTSNWGKGKLDDENNKQYASSKTGIGIGTELGTESEFKKDIKQPKETVNSPSINEIDKKFILLDNQIKAYDKFEKSYSCLIPCQTGNESSCTGDNRKCDMKNTQKAIELVRKYGWFKKSWVNGNPHSLFRNAKNTKYIVPEEYKNIRDKLIRQKNLLLKNQTIQFKLMTFNIEYGGNSGAKFLLNGRNVSFNKLIIILNANQPDIICLQETDYQNKARTYDAQTLPKSTKMGSVIAKKLQKNKDYSWKVFNQKHKIGKRNELIVRINKGGQYPIKKVVKFEKKYPWDSTTPENKDMIIEGFKITLINNTKFILFNIHLLWIPYPGWKSASTLVSQREATDLAYIRWNNGPVVKYVKNKGTRLFSIKSILQYIREDISNNPESEYDYAIIAGDLNETSHLDPIQRKDAIVLTKELEKASFNDSFREIYSSPAQIDKYWGTTYIGGDKYDDLTKRLDYIFYRNFKNRKSMLTVNNIQIIGEAQFSGYNRQSQAKDLIDQSYTSYPSDHRALIATFISHPPKYKIDRLYRLDKNLRCPNEQLKPKLNFISNSNLCYYTATNAAEDTSDSGKSFKTKQNIQPVVPIAQPKPKPLFTKNRECGGGSEVNKEYNDKKGNKWTGSTCFQDCIDAGYKSAVYGHPENMNNDPTNSQYGKCYCESKRLKDQGCNEVYSKYYDKYDSI